MNLEEELATLESKSNIMNNVNDMSQSIPMNNIGNEIINKTNNNDMMNNNNMNTIPQFTNQPIQNQPAIVNTTQAAQQAQGFNYANLEFDINKPLFERNPLERLTGDKGETFRIHMLPNVSPRQVHVHWDAEKGHNFICLKDAYGTVGEPCCGTHKDPKLRIVIPIVVYPTVQGNPNALVPGQRAELRTLFLGY